MAAGVNEAAIEDVNRVVRMGSADTVVVGCKGPWAGRSSFSIRGRDTGGGSTGIGLGGLEGGNDERVEREEKDDASQSSSSSSPSTSISSSTSSWVVFRISNPVPTILIRFNMG